MSRGKRPRRPNGEGSITRRSDGRYQGSFYDSLGKRRYVYHEKRNECAALLRAAIARVKQGERSNKTVGVWLIEWLEVVKKKNYRANTYQQRFYTIHHRLMNVFGAIPLGDLDAIQIEEWIAAMIEEGLSAVTIQTYYRVLSAALKNAVRKKLLLFNPCEGVELPHVIRKEGPILNLQEAHQLLAVIKGRWIEPIIVVLLGTGLRLGEVLALKWADVDLEEHTLFVCRNVARIARGPKTGFVEGPPKSESSKRTVALADFVVEELRAHRRAQNEYRLSQGAKWVDNDLVFPNPAGNYRYEQTVDRNLASAMIKARLSPKITPHRLRHSTGSILHAMGIDSKTIQAILGHASIQVTMDIYVDPAPSAQREAMDKLNRAFKKGEETG